MLKTFITPCLLGAAIFLGACNKHIYVPNTVNAPLLKEQYEFKGSVSPTNYQAAFAITNHIAVMANGQYVFRPFGNNNDNDDVFVDRYAKGGLFEGGIGFFSPLDVKKRMVFDVYTGLGSGSFKTLDAAYHDEGNTGNVNDYLLRSHFSKFFVQPSIGFVHPAIETAFSSRFSVVNFYNMYLGNKAFENDNERRDAFGQISQKTRFFMEPAFTFRAGYKYVKFQMQLSFAVPLSDDGYDNRYDESTVNKYFQPVSFGLGASINIAHWYDNFHKK
ncbi:MAG TPA: hypothetical protein VIM87_07430 [Chitinophaga sp.]|uniref:hypothetical protein n=1 Tax=Chitinophaga sp. TaxID=1869181 RepID=UPI002F952143